MNDDDDMMLDGSGADQDEDGHHDMEDEDEDDMADMGSAGQYT